MRIFCLFTCIFLFWESVAQASENERYKAIPLGGGASVFIIDTREGHIWTWVNEGRSAAPSGSNNQIRYQGNVSQKKTIEPHAGMHERLPAPTSPKSERY